MEIGQSPVNSAYSQPAPAERSEAPRQERLQSSQTSEPVQTTTPTPAPQSTSVTGPVGGNIDTYA